MADLTAEFVYTSFDHQEALEAMFAELDQAWPKEMKALVNFGLLAKNSPTVFSRDLRALGSEEVI
ncbi:hypothetical protein [Roseibium sp. RKSG952]|uniref:hypothetical protein n=1 Tax=Roseibium sp. RKSG952 TaxID=2529384 RepID=UPI0012BD3B6C|nr:hypothetical protein [Roseibium sp. RKSG952]MTH95773.1 hypothetical protein [Roseibium sp. RKSG952]